MKNIDRKMQKKCQVIYHTILNKGLYISYELPFDDIKGIKMRQFKKKANDMNVCSF